MLKVLMNLRIWDLVMSKKSKKTKKAKKSWSKPTIQTLSEQNYDQSAQTKIYAAYGGGGTVIHYATGLNGSLHTYCN